MQLSNGGLIVGTTRPAALAILHNDVPPALCTCKKKKIFDVQWLVSSQHDCRSWACGHRLEDTHGDDWCAAWTKSFCGRSQVDIGDVGGGGGGGQGADLARASDERAPSRKKC